MMKKKKIYEAPTLEFFHVDVPSILAGTEGSNSVVTGDKEAIIGGGGGGGYEGGEGEEGLSRRGGGFWDDDF